MKRLLQSLLVAAALGGALPAGAEVQIARVFTGWREADSFKRISEYFDGKENTGGIVVMRTQPDARAGYYFLVRLKGMTATGSARFRLAIIPPAPAPARTHEFACQLDPRTPVYNLGLTGSDWPDAKAHPVAWRLEVVTEDGARVLASQQSFLWQNNATR